MKIIPILFSTPMVQAILNGNKSMTRRKCKHQFWTFHELVDVNKNGITQKVDRDVSCPYGHTGDILLLKEGYYQLGHWTKNGKTKTGRQKWSFVPASDDIRYCDNAPETFKKSMDSVMPYENMWYKRTGRFMPYKYARIFLRRTDTRVEQLRDIKYNDARAEGIVLHLDIQEYTSPHDPDTYYSDPFDAFESLWLSINGADSWNANPWVWVIAFERITSVKEIAEIRKQWNERRAK